MATPIRRRDGAAGLRMVLSIAVSIASFVLLLKFGTRNDFIVEFDGRRIVVEERGAPHDASASGSPSEKFTPIVSNTFRYRIHDAWNTYFQWPDLRVDIQGINASYADVRGDRVQGRIPLGLAEGQEAVIDEYGRVRVQRMGRVPGDPP